MTIEYQNALTEVEAILKLMPKDMLNKIPSSFLNFIEQKKSKTYIPNLNMELSLNEQILLNETRAILSLIYRNYLCNTEEKRKLKIDDSIELAKKQNELNKKYSYENLFNRNKN